MLDKMKEAAEGINQSSSRLLEMKKTVAAFYVFQCYLHSAGNMRVGMRYNSQLAMVSILGGLSK